MQINTTFSCGDIGYAFSENRVRALTIGQIRVEVTDSPGHEGYSFYSNYAPQKGYEEVVMCVETGIGSGTLWTVGKTIFKSEAVCAAVSSAKIAAVEAEKKRLEEYKLEQAKQELLEAEAKIRRLKKIVGEAE